MTIDPQVLSAIKVAQDSMLAFIKKLMKTSEERYGSEPPQWILDGLKSAVDMHDEMALAVREQDQAAAIKVLGSVVNAYIETGMMEEDLRLTAPIPKQLLS